MVSALAVVLAQLLPDALGGAGLWALPVFALGAALPWAAGKLSGGLRSVRGAVGLELGYLGLLVHKVADGIALGTYGGEQHAGHGHGDVLFALSAHTVPMVALVALAYQRRAGWRAAILRVLGLLAATIAGAVGANLAPAAALGSVEPWITAAVAGLLLHVVAHDWEAARGPRRARDRLVDLVAVVAGVGLVLAGGHQHHDGEDVRAAVGDALWELSLETAPALLFGLAVGALVSAWGPGRLPSRWLGGGALRQAMVGASIGAPLPICACGVLPLAQSLRGRGAGAALVVAFMLATPELGVETFALTGQLLGWPFAFVRLGAAVLLAMLAALAVHRASGVRGAPPRESLPAGAGPAAPFARRLSASFDELVHHVAPWTVVGLVAAAYVQATLGEGSLGAFLPYPLELLAMTLVAVPSYVCAASATPLAAVLVAKG
ncbi:MAG: permease [Sandaracinaceae bacterium]|nr:permease [Sandaracinaceae bacterium]